MNRVDLTEASWVKSSYSNAQSSCVEIATVGGGAVPVRDSKNIAGPVIVLSEHAWHAFLTGIDEKGPLTG
ncbi:DUF397 domain-containing protein [Streptomyces sp. ITFR-6]|uniref:DUF397 domain-containing protein n=1 Tax=Streptomyces sp. ITFR-6 TaxID=3075197 RepID=UPI00288ABFEF|nr:DUF397 domain-containing protein [Streptomyces sp. ITFR-6]WNI31366.1 DUF397 domain-containing protein [Streptomyces sp. ITFR-6]